MMVRRKMRRYKIYAFYIKIKKKGTWEDSYLGLGKCYFFFNNCEKDINPFCFFIIIFLFF